MKEDKSNTEEIEQPKALKEKINKTEQNVENNNGQVPNKQEDPTKFKKIKPKKNKNTFIKKYILFIIILAIITAIAIYLTMQYLDKNVDEETQESNENSITVEIENKKSADDAKYGIKSYSETYNENDLKILDYMDIDGKVYLYDMNNPSSVPEGKVTIEFIQIEGLKDKSLQNKINERLKTASYNLKQKIVNTSVTANFGNILSVCIISYSNEAQSEKYDFINVDLTTGEDIPLEKVFVSSAPINTYLAEGLYEKLAWSTFSDNSGENFEFDHDMKKADTSEFEEKFMQLANNYKKKKGNIKYFISKDGVTVYELTDKNILKNYSSENSYINIKFINHIEEVAIYKRYLTDSSIFENNNVGEKDVIVLTNKHPYRNYNVFTTLNYGKVKDNIFMEDVIEQWVETDEKEGINTIKKYLQNLSDEQKSKLNVDGNKGMFYQRVMHLEKSEKDYYIVNINECTTTCDIAYFENEAFKDYISMKNRPTADASYSIFNGYMKDQYPNLNIEEKNMEGWSDTLYFSKKGEFIGKSEKEAEAKLGITKKDTNTQVNENVQVPDNSLESIQSQPKSNTIKNNADTNTNSVINNSTDTNNISTNEL